MRVEICVNSVDGAVAAQEGGADRVELGDNLFEGGTTPSGSCIKVARQKLRIGIQVMGRNHTHRAGNELEMKLNKYHQCSAANILLSIYCKRFMPIRQRS